MSPPRRALTRTLAVIAALIPLAGAAGSGGDAARTLRDHYGLPRPASTYAAFALVPA